MSLTLVNVLIIYFICNVGAYEKGSRNVISRLHLKSNIGRWLFRKVFYDVDPYLTKDALVALTYTIDYMNSLTCVKWIQRYPWDDDVTDYVSFLRHMDSKEMPHCGSLVGRVGGKQTISIGDWCFAIRDFLKRKTTLLHEMMHAMGFQHEVQRPDRDCFLFINETYKKKNNYVKLDAGHYEYDSPYDFESVMQYESLDDAHMHSLEHQKLGRRDGKLSPMDIIKVNNLYCGKENYCELYPKDCQDYKQWKVRMGCLN